MQLDVVCGAGGFIGGHLVKSLLDLGQRVRAVDIKPPEEWHQRFNDAENLVLDLKRLENCRSAVKGATEIYNLACDMGGIGYIETHKARCMSSVLINTHLLMASCESHPDHYFFSSSACVYAADKQASANLSAPPLKEEDAYPALPEDGYGWEKLFSERMCRHFTEDLGLATRVARFHDIYGPHSTWDGGREKAPAAICRKVIQAKLSDKHEIEIWGTGRQIRSFTYIDDCVHGINLMMRGEHPGPVNLGSDEAISVNQLVSIIEDIAGVTLKRTYRPLAPVGVAGRNSDNSLVKKLYGWSPETRLRDGLEKTYKWIYDEIISGRSPR